MSEMEPGLSRRLFLGAAAVSSAAYGADEAKVTPRKGRLRQGVCGGVFGRDMPIEDRCRHAARLGVVGYDLLGEKDWPMLKKYGLIPSMVPGGGTLPVGLNHVENHARFEADMHQLIDKCAEVGAPNLIGLTGNRKGQPIEQGIENCVKVINKVKSHLEDKNVTLCVEYLNSKVNHPDYDFDHMRYGVEICKRTGSPRVKILYDMYHAQIMEGDIIRTIRDNFQYIGHFHTAGNPGRHEMDDSQEMNYRGIAKAIADLGYKGIVSHEYTPTKDAIPTLEQTLATFDV